MSKKARSYEEIGTGEPCPKCGELMARREHKEITEKQKNASYYFREWDYCKKCQHVQHYEHLKVFNR